MYIRAEKVYAAAGLFALLLALVTWVMLPNSVKPQESVHPVAPPRTTADYALLYAVGSQSFGESDIRREAGAAREALLAGANPNMTAAGYPLITILDPKQRPIARLLLLWGADPNATGPDGRTAAMHCIESTYYGIRGEVWGAQEAYDRLADLLIAGADPRKRDPEGHDLYDYIEGRLNGHNHGEAHEPWEYEKIKEDPHWHREFLRLLEPYGIPDARQARQN